MDNAAHPFTRAGYAAPYTLVGPHEAVYQACTGAPVQAAGSCDVCGTCYRYGATWRDAAGLVFRTGCDCAIKGLASYDPASVAALKAARASFRAERDAERRAVKREERAARRDAERLERERAEREAERQICEGIALDLETLERYAHPLAWARDKGLSAADAVRYWLDAGKVRRALEVAQEIMSDIEAGTAAPLVIVPTIDPDVSQHVGAVKARMVFEARIVAAIHFETAYGFSSILKMVDDAGNALAWKSARPWGILPLDADDRELTPGRRLRFKATIKSHGADSHNADAPITWLARAKAC